MKKIVFLVIGIMLIGFCLSSMSSSAADETPDVPLWIDATYKIDFINMTTMNISTTFAIHEIKIEGYEDTVTADFIRENYNNLLGKGIINGTKLEIDRSFNETINTTFRNDTIVSEDTLFDVSSLVDTEPVDDSYQSPINFTKNATVAFNVTSFGFEENPNLKLNDVIQGTLKMGAVINKAFTLKAEAGYKNTFILMFSDDFKPTSMTDEDFLDTTVTWTVDNLKAAGLSDSISISKSLIIESRSPNPTAKEEVLTNLTINMYNFDELYLYGTIDIKSANITKYNVSLPSNITNLSYISSDGLRMALKNGLVEWEDIEREINNITKDAKETLSDVFNTTINLNFTWFELNKKDYNLSNMGSDRPVNATFIGFNETNSTKIRPNLFGDFDNETITGILNAGAKYNFTVSASEENYTIKMILPENMNLTSISKAEYKEDDGRNSYLFNSKIGLSCTLFSDIAREYNESRALLNILIDMHDVNIFSMALNVDLIADAKIYCIELSDVGMPENITMKYINSDCLRLLYAKNIIKQSDIDNITNEIKKSLEENLTNSLGGNVSISVCIDQDSLTGYDVNNMRDDSPVKISAEAHISISLEQASSGKSSTLLMRTGNSVSCEQTMSLSFLTRKLPDISLNGMEGFNTTYTIILPKGINVIKADDTLRKLQHGTTKDGRAYLTVTLNETEEDTVSITIDATGLILNIVLPFIILGIIIPVVSIIAKLMRRKEGKLE